MAGETFQHIEFSNDSSPYISDTNLNELQTRVDNAIKTQKNRITNLKQMEGAVNISTAGWYRVATIYGNTDSKVLPGKGAIIEIVPTWNMGQPCSVMLSILSVYNKIKITQLNAIAVNAASTTITKARALWDDTNSCFYIDVYYYYNTPNSLYVKNLSFLDSDYNGGVELNTPAVETFSGTALSEITINYNKIEPYYRYIDSYLINSWSVNGQSICEVDELGVKHITISVRNGTSSNVFQLPDELKPETTILLPATNGSAVGYATIYLSGIIAVSGNIYTSGSSNFVASGTYK